MENLNDEEQAILQNLDGVVVEENKDKQNPEEDDDQKKAINEDYFTKIFKQTMEKYQNGQYGGVNAAMRTGT